MVSNGQLWQSDLYMIMACGHGGWPTACGRIRLDVDDYIRSRIVVGSCEV